ncbi:tRNA(Ile)-lysidine synthase [Morganella morganii]|nr:tRNA(Ile)-lysidine synthase [Morganella morganii]
MRPWLRERTPLLWYNDTLIAAVGVFVTKEGEADEAKLMIMQEKKQPRGRGCRVIQDGE